MAASVVIIIVNIITLRALYLNLPKVMCFFIFFIFLFFYFPPPLGFLKGDTVNTCDDAFTYHT